MANMELLRIIAMLMVVMLHYLSKGMQLPAMTGPQGVRGMLAWGMESLAIVAVNVYMLISGYFLTEGRFRTGRLIQLICQVLFYSILVTAVLLCTGQLVLSDLTIYELLQVLLSLGNEPVLVCNCLLCAVSSDPHPSQCCAPHGAKAA